jgi:hypothetical protein
MSREMPMMPVIKPARLRRRAGEQDFLFVGEELARQLRRVEVEVGLADDLGGVFQAEPLRHR